MKRTEAVLATPFGSPIIRCRGSQLTEETLRSLLEKLYPIFDNFAERGLFIGHLRQIVIAGDFRNEVACWQREIGHPVGVTENEEGAALGKALFWGGGDRLSDFYAVVIVSDLIADGILTGKPIAEHLFAHELGHLDNHISFLHKLGLPATTRLSNWSEIRQGLAVALYDECMADLAALSFADRFTIEQRAAHLKDVVQATTTCTLQELKSYEQDGDLTTHWGNIVSQLSDLFASCGRAIGSLIGEDEDLSEIRKGLLNDVAQLSLCWAKLLERIFGVVASLMDAPSIALGQFGGLEDLIETWVLHLGVRPVGFRKDFHILYHLGSPEENAAFFGSKRTA